MSLKTVVIDDEVRALSLMTNYVNKVTSLTLVASFRDAIAALEFLNKEHIDILFLDIHMPDINGLELLASLKQKPIVIFTTAFPEYAVKGFQLDAQDYLVKPIMFPRFLQAANKAVNQARLISVEKQSSVNFPKVEQAEVKESGQDYIFLKVDTRWERIQLSEITYLQACGDYVEIHCLGNKKVLTLQTLTQMMERLSGKIFIRVHRSYIVNLPLVDTINKDHLIIGNVDITISKSYRQAFFERLNQTNL